jgi:hypothetical protein
MANWAKSIVVYVLAGVVPAISYIALGGQLFSIGGREIALGPRFLFSFIASAAFGFVLGGRGSAFLIVFFALVGICVGVIANAAYDFDAHGIDHNLFGIEIIVDAILVVPGMLCGLATAWFNRVRK